MLEIRDLRYEVDDGDRTLGILQGISLTIPEHKFIVVTGPNGGGKTTLAKAIMGIVEPTGGQILWNGQDVTHMSITDRARLGISYGFQQPPRFKGLRVRDLLSMAAGNDKLTRDEACQYLTRVGLCAKDYIDREVDTSLSGVMIFDEPEAGIDLWSFARLTETFRDIHDRRDATLIVISHQERIIDLADEIIMVSGGQIVKQGPKDQIFPEILANTISGCSYLTEGAKA